MYLDLYHLLTHSLTPHYFPSNTPLPMQVTGPLGEPVGTVYLDLYQRSNKFPGAAHFTLRCGCSNIDGFSTIDGLSAIDGFHGSSTITSRKQQQQGQQQGHGRINETNDPKQYQLPIVALSFSFSPQLQKGVTQNGQNKTNTDPLLSLHDVETLHHEWGNFGSSIESINQSINQSTQCTFQHPFTHLPPHPLAHLPTHPTNALCYSIH